LPSKRSLERAVGASHCFQKELWIEQLLLGMAGTSTLPSKRTQDRTATVGHGWYLHIAFKKKLGEGGV